MASTCSCEKPAADRFSLLTQNSQNDALFKNYSSPDDLSLTPPESCDEFLSSPVSPTLSPTLSAPSYKLVKIEDLDKSEQIFSFGSVDDWMGWDELDPADNALTPTSDYFPELKLEPASPKMSGFDRQSNGSINPARIQEETSAVFGGDTISEETLFQSPSSLFASPINDPTQNLYSTPLSWSTPTAGLSDRRFTRLSQAEELHLRSIAMPSFSSNFNPSKTYAGSPSSTSSPEPPSHRRKRKSSVEDDDDEDMSDVGNVVNVKSGKPVKKTAHNMIEKRYRTNLNDKIAALRDSVPSLRVVSKSRSNSLAKDEDLQGLTPAHKLNKATVLAKATEYIAHLEKRNKLLTKENATLKARVEAFELLMQNRQAQLQQNTSRPTVSRPQPNGRYSGSFDGMLS